MPSAPQRAPKPDEPDDQPLREHLAERERRLAKIRASLADGTFDVDSTVLSKVIIDRHIVRK